MLLITPREWDKPHQRRIKNIADHNIKTSYFNMSDTSHSPSCYHGVPHIGDNGIRGFRSKYTSHSLSCNNRVYGCGDQIGNDSRGGYRYQYNSHSYSINHGSIVDVDGIGGYRYHTIHSSSDNPGGRGRLLGFLFLLVLLTIMFMKLRE